MGRPRIHPEGVATKIAHQAYRDRRKELSEDPKVRRPATYDQCPTCDGTKSKIAKTCKDCYTKTRGNIPNIDSKRMANRQMVTGK